MVNENFEHFRKEEQVNNTEQNADKTDTLFYKPFSSKKSEKQHLQLKHAEENEEKKEVLKERFAELAILLESGSVDTNIDIAGERHWMQVDSFLKKGNNIDSAEIVKGVNAGERLNNISIAFNLEKTEQRAESLIIKVELPVTCVLRGGGELKKRLYEEITNIFAGSSLHDQSIKNEQLDVQPEESTINFLEKEEENINKRLLDMGAELSKIQTPDQKIIVADFPKNEKQVIISRIGNKLPWYVSVLNQKNIKNSFVAGQPEEILPEVTRFIESTT